MLLRRIARPLLSAAFIGQGVEALRNPDAAAEAARPATEYLRGTSAATDGSVLEDPKQFARITAAVQIGAGLLLATGKLPRTSSAVLAATVIPANLGAHMFWTETDPVRKLEKRRAFLTDVSLLGGLMIASADTAGRPSLGWRGQRAAKRFTESVSSTFGDNSSSWLEDSELGERLSHGLQSGLEHGRELASTAGEKSAPLLEAARKRGSELAETALERGAHFAERARERGADFAEIARERGADLAETARERGADFAEVARERGADFADTARDRGIDWAETARARGVDLAETARERGVELAENARKERRKKKRLAALVPGRR